MYTAIRSIRVLALLSLMFALPAYAVSNEQSNTSHALPDNPQSQYFRHIMFRESPYAPYRGIYHLDSNTPPGVAHYQFKQDKQGRVIQIRYQQKDALIRANEVWDSFIWFAPRVDITYEANTETHTYYDIQGNRIAAHGNVFTAVYELNNNKQRVALRFYDQQGNASESEWNIHRYEWRHSQDKVYEKRFNLNDEQQPLRPEFAFYEVELEYDRDGKLAFIRNLGLTGEPTNNETGAGIDRITYDHNGNFIRWQVYDKEGRPVEGNRPMVHLGEHLYDADGNKVGLRRMVIEYNPQQTEITWLKALGEKRELVSSPMFGGAAALQFEYQSDGNIVRHLFNADMSTFNPPKKSASE